ncbi:MAG: PqqD family protein [Okeania sp. SIO2G4]|uniref:PqqD family protein n=1 Tax=unclassified Okeania TaxID=2634635 RepID=UPI0013B5F46A|nr:MULTISPECIES: PqqD family protein [unclassified Okeania]NEP72064.1 PqqD family protein [Okeania sp. SIO2G5]NEP92920.1 PqqD family protein [Okeania sp. SIO2F5]NEQ91040.1 PqqD family protein [Okeania sp. SIO2G4]
MENTERFQINSPKVVQETIEGEVVIVNLDKGDYYSLLNTGADIWSAIEKGNSTTEIIAEMTERYEGDRKTIETAVNSLITQLREEEIIIVAPINEGENQNREEVKATTDNKQKLPFERPILSKYTDMEELLALDPIHEVDEMGWPNAKVNTLI